MDSAAFGRLLERLGACIPAKIWAHGKSAAEVWATCEHPDWMLWLAGRLSVFGSPERTVLLLATANCGALALPLFERRFPEDKRPSNAVQMAYHVAYGVEKSSAAESAARDSRAACVAATTFKSNTAASLVAAAAADVASAASSPVAAYSYAANAVYGVCDAAAYDGGASYPDGVHATAFAAAAAARAVMERKCLDIVRYYIPTCPLPLSSPHSES